MFSTNDSVWTDKYLKYKSKYHELSMQLWGGSYAVLGLDSFPPVLSDIDVYPLEQKMNYTGREAVPTIGSPDYLKDDLTIETRKRKDIVKDLVEGYSLTNLSNNMDTGKNVYLKLNQMVNI